MSTGTPSTALLSARANKLDLLERLADDLAHEIKNPLHSMVINLEVLKRRITRQSGPEQSDEMLRYIRVLGGELERVNKRIELLLRLTRPGRGAEVTTFDELLDELIELIELEATHQEVSVRLDHAGLPARVRVPRDAARQVILNLVLEVLDHLAAGDVLEIRTEARTEHALLVVQGLPAASEEAVPSPPNNGDAANGAVRLAAARTLAESFGGAIASYDSANGRPGGVDDGLSLAFFLPVAR